MREREIEECVWVRTVSRLCILGRFWLSFMSLTVGEYQLFFHYQFIPRTSGDLLSLPILMELEGFVKIMWAKTTFVVVYIHITNL